MGCLCYDASVRNFHRLNVFVYSRILSRLQLGPIRRPFQTRTLSSALRTHTCHAQRRPTSNIGCLRLPRTVNNPGNHPYHWVNDRPTLHDCLFDRGRHALQNQRQHLSDTQNAEKFFIEILDDSDSVSPFTDSAFHGCSICH